MDKISFSIEKNSQDKIYRLQKVSFNEYFVENQYPPLPKIFYVYECNLHRRLSFINFICLFIYLYIHPSICLSIYLFFILYIYPTNFQLFYGPAIHSFIYICISIYQSISINPYIHYYYLSIYIFLLINTFISSIYSYIYLSIYQSTNLSIYLHIYPSIYPTNHSFHLYFHCLANHFD